MTTRPHLSVVADAVAPEPPFPPDTRAKGWRFELDYERIEQSDTWAIAPAEARPWLLMLWLTAWRQVPCGSLPNSDELIAARIGMPAMQFGMLRAVLMRGWRLHADGRLYHTALIEQVNSMLAHRKTEAARVRAWRERREEKEAKEADVTRYQPVSTTPEPEPEPKTFPNPNGLGVVADPDGSPTPTQRQHEGLQPEEGVPRPVVREAVLLACPATKLVDLYHRALPMAPQCLVLTKTRSAYLRARWREYAVAQGWQTQDEGLAFFADYFAHVSKSKFLTGRTRGRDDRPPFVADIEWLFRPSNFAKVVEGKYNQ